MRWFFPIFSKIMIYQPGAFVWMQIIFFLVLLYMACFPFLCIYRKHIVKQLFKKCLLYSKLSPHEIGYIHTFVWKFQSFWNQFTIYCSQTVHLLLSNMKLSEGCINLWTTYSFTLLKWFKNFMASLYTHIMPLTNC
jgi:hypothetical protein